MGLQSWEKVLLEWVHTFGFTKTNHITLELTDIDAFFAYYVQKAQVEPVPVVEVALQAQPTHHLSPDVPISGQLTPLQAFLKEIYPEFNGHLNGQGRLAGSDYLYVYSLLLHYKCVKQPSASFHSICKKLPALTQSYICEFFQQTMNRPLTRESLHQAIANVSRVVQAPGAAEIKASRATSSLSLDSDGSGHCSSLGDDSADLPIDCIGPMSSPSPKTMPPPATPKTELLEQRTREVRGLQAQLEAERYEKNVLEEQIMENEHLIKSLRKENKVKKMQLAKLKDSDENEDEDSIRKYVPNEFDHLKCSLLKEISQKEAILTETRDKLQDLRIENSELRSKVKTSVEQLVVCMDRIRDLEVRQEELSQALSTKSDQINSLESDKQELEKCLQVTRDELHNRREVLNSSSDLLDLPMSPNTTPENLADSVIDKQLREKEHENLELKEELQKTSNALLGILEDHGLSMSSVSEDHSSQLWSAVCVVKEELARSVQLNELRESQLQEKSQQLDRALVQFAKLLEKGRDHAKELDEINAKYEQMLCSHLASKQELQSQNDRLLQSLNQANDKSAEADKHLQKIKLQLAEKEEQMVQLGSELLELRDKNKTLESRTNSLITERNSGVFQLQQEQRRQEYVRNKYAQCRDQLVAQTSDMSQLFSHLDESDWVGTLRKVNEVIIARDEVRQQLDALKLEHAQTKKESQDLEERLQLSVKLQQSVQQSHDQQQADLQQELLMANEQMETMRQCNLQYVDEIETDLNNQLLNSQQKMQSFLARITALLNGDILVKSEDSFQLPEFEEFESKLALSLRYRSQEVATLQATADKLRGQLDALQRQYDSVLEKESKERASRMTQLMRFTHSLEVSAAKVRSTLVAKDAEIAAGKQQAAKLQEQLANDQASSIMLKQLNDTIDNLEQVNEKLIDDNSKLQNLHMDMSTSLLTVNGEVERLTNELAKCKSSLAEMSASDKLKATKLSASAKEHQVLQDRLIELCAKISMLEEHIEHLRTSNSDFEERCQELEKQLAEKESQASRLDKDHTEELEVISTKLKDAQFKVDQQRQAIMTEREEISKYRAQLAETTKARDQCEEEMAKLRVLLSHGERDNQDHLKTIKDLHGKEQQLAQQIEKLIGEHSGELRRLQALLTDEQEVTSQLRNQLSSATELAQARAAQKSQAELAQVELAASLQHEKAMMEQLRVEAEAKSAAAYERISKLEKLRETQDHKARQLSDQLAEAEKLKVHLNLEIGGLNSDIEQRKRQIAEQANELSTTQNMVTELQCQLKSEVEGHNQVKEELDEITSKLSEVQQELNSARLVQDTQYYELDEKTREIELERAEAAERDQHYQRRIESLEGQLAEFQAASQAQAPPDLCKTYSKEECTATAADEELPQLRQEMAKSKMDCKILQAKYRETKDEILRCEQKMKDQRLEMEGKLDKMKTKMRSLYTAEVTRMKEKQERDAASNKAELEALSAQNAKYEEHTRKLSNQIVRLNEKILEQKKQNAIISTKLSHLQMQPLSVPKASASAPMVTVSVGSSAANDDWQPFKRPNAPSSNLAMEDEEGEVFNNTYLTDLKLGRIPDITAEELNYRNSLQPPHLKSTYAAQYDLSSQDEDLKDGPHSLDDSMCALLSSTGNATRKKSIGTHYKRPGPPTPSKNGGRLSFGSSEPPREVLREFGDHSNASKTPARFKFLTTRFSVGSSGLPRDENSPPKRRLSNMFKRKERQ